MTAQPPRASDANRGQMRTYARTGSAVFCKTKERYGGLSNMAGGFPLCVNGVRIRTSEALYQACRFPHRSEVQRLIIDQRSPMTAKMKGKPHRHDSRGDWTRVRVAIMRWCLRVKLAQHWDAFGELLRSTDDRPIVELSRKDEFWGAKPVDARTLRGVNALGRLLMELRQLVQSEPRESFLLVEPLKIPEFLLNGCPIEQVVAGEFARLKPVPLQAASRTFHVVPAPTARELPLGGSSPKEVPSVREDSPEYLTGSDSDTMRPYSAYRDSGINWLGEVPAHWDVRRLRTVAKMRVSNVDKHVKDGERPVRLCNYVDVYKNDRIRPGMEFMRATATPGEIERFHLRCGDVLITKDSESWNDIGVPALVESTEDDIVCGYHLALLRPVSNYVDGGYLFRALQSSGVTHQLQVEANGVTRFGLTHDGIKSIWLPLPSLAEQVAIVRFLDHVDSRIRRYVRAKQKLIAVLEEQKQAVIQQAVTGRIDVRTGRPYPKYKPSGVEWLGQTPEHWRVAALRHRYSQCLGKMLDSKRITGRHSLPYLRNVDVQWDRINIENLPVMDIAPDEYERYTLRRGDLLICEGGEMGRSALWSGELSRCGFQKALHRLRPRNAGQDVPRFMHYALRAAVKGNAFDDGHLSTIAHLTGEKLRTHRFPFPPVAEQESLVTFLDGELKQIDRSVSRVRRQIELLQEYRTRLIADVVVGKLDVREAATELPDVDSVGVEYDGGDAGVQVDVSDPKRMTAGAEHDAAAEVMPDERNHPAGREERA